jgi:UDP-N-acetylmuramate dehydrogenase
MLKQNIALSDYSNYKIGGSALYFLEVFSKEELLKGLKDWEKVHNKEKRIFVLGQGTNVLFSDAGFNGLVIKNSIGGIKKLGDKVEVGAGVELPRLNDFCIENALSGLEWSGGLPGTIGGAIRGNAGAFNGETKDNIEEVTSLNLTTLALIKRNKKECNFSYRNSIFKTEAHNEIIISAVLGLKEGNQEEIQDNTNEKIEHRKNKHPLEYPNIGSIFKNVPVQNFDQNFREELSQYIKNDPFPVIPAAKLIFLAGLKGKKVGGVMISEKHTNFIVNLGQGKAQDVKELIEIVRKEIKNKFGVILEEEIMYV